MPTEVLILLSQALQDPSSGAACSLRSMGRLLAQSRSCYGNAEFHVRFLGTTATEAGGLKPDAARFLRQAGLNPIPKQHPIGPVLHCEDHGVACTMWDSSGYPHLPNTEREAALDCLLDELVFVCTPQIVLTFGGQAPENERRMRLHARGATVVFGLRNWGYLHEAQNFFSPACGIDAVLSPSEFHLGYYRSRFTLPSCSAALPALISKDDVLAEKREFPGAVTFVNPTLDKGAMVFLWIADELDQRRPDIPFLVVESRGDQGLLRTLGREAAIDLSRLTNLRFLLPQSKPREIYARTRILLMPSVWNEPAGRLVGEALLNGIPPIVSDRGGPPAECHGAGTIIPLPSYLQPDRLLPLMVADAEPWIAAILHLWDSADAYAAAVARVREAAKAFDPVLVGRRYLDFFRSIRPPR